MTLWRVGFLLLVASIRNWIRRALQRMRNPRYLIGGLLVALYFFWFVGKWLVIPSTGDVGVKMPLAVSDALTSAVIALAFAFALVWSAGTWLFGRTERVIRFSEAEVIWLFAAPFTRRQILHFKLARGMINTGLGGLLGGLFFARAGIGHPLFACIGGPLVMITLWLHTTGISLSRASLLRHGRSGLRRQLGTLLAVAAGVVLLAGFAARRIPAVPVHASWDAWGHWIERLLATPPLSWIVFPVKALVMVVLAKDGRSFGLWLAVGLAVAAVNYVWVLRRDAAFEEGALESAEKRAEAKAARTAARSGRGRALSSKRLSRPWFRLPVPGRPEWALTWKAAVGAQRAFGTSVLIFLLALAAPLAALVASFSASVGTSAALPIAGGVCALLSLATALLGPLIVRSDLRAEVEQMDVLRSFPLTGAQVVKGEMLGVWALLTLAECSLVLCALICLAPRAPVAWSWRIGGAAALLFLIPALTLAELCVHNATAVLFPGWLSAESGKRGFEAMGQRMLGFLATTLVLLIGLLPAAAVGGIGGMVLWLLGLHVGGVVFGSLTAAGVLYVEAAVAVQVLGKAFDGTDLSV